MAIFAKLTSSSKKKAEKRVQSQVEDRTESISAFDQPPDTLRDLERTRLAITLEVSSHSPEPLQIFYSATNSYRYSKTSSYIKL
jgi:hypothetical protein